jgi:hypothetical protein
LTKIAKNTEKILKKIRPNPAFARRAPGKGILTSVLLALFQFYG